MKEYPSQIPQIIMMLLGFVFIIAAACMESFHLAWIAFFMMSSALCMMADYTDRVERYARDEEMRNAEAFAMLNERSLNNE